MSPLHKIILFIIGFTFRSALFFGLTLLAALLLIGNKTTLKDTLIEINAYQRFSQSIIDGGKEQASKDQNAIPLDRPEIALALQQSLDQTTLQSITESFIDSSYKWLNGDTPSIDFSADVSKNKDLLARQVSGYAVERIATLPPCDGIPNQTNIFNVECNPVGLDLGAQRAEVYKTLMNDESIFPNEPLTASSLPVDSRGRSFQAAYSSAPNYYKMFKIAPWALLGIALICAGAIVVMSRKKRRGLRTIATGLISTGIILAITPVLYIYMLPALGISLPGSSGSRTSESFAAISSDFTSSLYSQFNMLLINIAIQTVVIGLIMLFALRFFGDSKKAYHGLQKKAGVAVSVPSSARPSVKVSRSDVPVQTSEKRRVPRHSDSKLSKKYRKM